MPIYNVSAIFRDIMPGDYMFYLLWNLKRYFWQLTLAVSFIVAVFLGTALIQNGLAVLFVLRLSVDLWRYFTFKPYAVVDPLTQEALTWQAVSKEFNSRTGRMSFYGVSRADISNALNDIMLKGTISQSNNNLCGPISFLNFLIKHNPTLFAKTFFEYYENGCTYAPFYLQSSFWDRYAYFIPVGLINRIFQNHYTSADEALAGAFKNTYNLLGYSNSCLVETFKGSTEPKQIVQWLEQAGYSCHSHVTVRNYKNQSEMPWLFRLLVGGVYSSDNKIDNPIVNEGEHCYLELSQSSGSTPLHFMFNVSNGHWTYSLNRNSSLEDYIQIHLPKQKILMEP